MPDNVLKKKNFYECYEIIIQGNAFRYTNAQEDVNYNSNVYYAVPISREDIITSADTEKGDVNIKMTKDAVFFSILRLGVPFGTIKVNFYLFSADDVLINRYVYTAVSVSCSNEDLTLSVKNESIIYDSKVNTQAYSRVCRFNLYDSSCTVNKDDYSQKITPVAISTSVLDAMINIPEEELTLYSGGYAEFSHTFESYNNAGDSATFDYRLNIIAVGYDQDDNALIYLSDNTWLIDGLTEVTIYQGCDKTTSYCRDQFNNIPNFGGQPEIPTENPNNGAVF